MDENFIAYQILIILNIISFILGFLIAKKKEQNFSISNPLLKKRKVVNNSEKDTIIQKVKIDDSKMDIGTNTQGIEKKYDILGNNSVSDENIHSSINKLKDLKK